jgi:hypothetical protein
MDNMFTGRIINQTPTLIKTVCLWKDLPNKPYGNFEDNSLVILNYTCKDTLWMERIYTIITPDVFEAMRREYDISNPTGTCSVRLVNYGTNTNKISAIKAIRDATGLGLKESKDLSEELPKTLDVVKEIISREAAQKLIKEFQQLGGTANFYKGDCDKCEKRFACWTE